MKLRFLFVILHEIHHDEEICVSSGYVLHRYVRNYGSPQVSDLRHAWGVQLGMLRLQVRGSEFVYLKTTSRENHSGPAAE